MAAAPIQKTKTAAVTASKKENTEPSEGKINEKNLFPEKKEKKQHKKML